MLYDLIIVGAGAAGLFAAANAPVDRKTLVLEKTDSPGQKLLLTGNGQCNLTNNEPIKAFLNRYGENGKRLRPVLFPFSNMALMEYFEQNGLPLNVREDGKVFPASMKSVNVLNLLLDISKNRGVAFRYKNAVTEIMQQAEKGKSRYSVKTTDGLFFSKNVLVATGGESYPQTGSDGSFFTCLEKLGLRLVPRYPALVPVFVHHYNYSSLSGLTFPICKVELTRGDSIPLPTGKNTVKAEGSLLLTHKGFSGPIILEISRYVTQGDRLAINYLPQRTLEDLRTELINTAAGSSKQIVTILESVTALPRGFLEHTCQRCGINKSEKASRLTGSEMGNLAERLTSDSFEVSGTGGFSTAMTTAGGVSLDEINLQTMEAKRYPGLYFAGEVIDVDGDTGGYNLQFAFSSAKRSIEAMQLLHRGCETQLRVYAKDYI